MKRLASVPCTPESSFREVSAFSPDTPIESPPEDSEKWYSCLAEKQGLEAQKQQQYERENSRSILQGRKLFVNIRTPPAPTCDSPTSTRASYRDLSPTPKASPCVPKRLRFEKSWDHEWTLDQLEREVHHSHHTLSLDSPVIVFLRRSNETTLLQAFRKIFPDVAEDLLGSLCAILVASNYLVSLIDTHERSNYPYGEYTLPRIDTPEGPTQAAYGTRFIVLLPEQARDRILWSRSLDIRKHVDAIFDRLVCRICGRTDETLKTTLVVLMEVLESR